MPTTFTQIDLSRLPAPQVIQPLDYETILQDMIADFRARNPEEYDAILESDPAIKVLEAAAYREVLLRQRVNDAARAVLLAFAVGADLDHIGARFNVERLDGESDTRFRRRIQLAHEAWTGAGTKGSYEYHALTASTEVGQVNATQTAPGRVNVIVYGDGAPISEDALEAVRARIHRDDVKALTDMVTVRRATTLPYTVAARLWLYYPPDESPVRDQAEAAVRAQAAYAEQFGYDITRSALIAAAHVAGVQRVELDAPSDDLIVNSDQIATLSSLTVTVAGRAR